MTFFSSNPRPLGTLEQSVMDVLWARSSELSVKDVAAILADRGLAYTTLMTTLDRLYRKGLLVREKRSHAYMYRPAMAKAAYDRRLVASLLEGVRGASREALVAGFLDFASADPAGLAALEQLLDVRKNGLDDRKS